MPARNAQRDNTSKASTKPPQANGAAVSSDEKSFATPTPPAVTNLMLIGGLWPRELTVEAGDDVDRVEFTLDGKLIGVAYGPPFQFYLSPSEMGMALSGSNRIAATATWLTVSRPPCCRS